MHLPHHIDQTQQLKPSDDLDPDPSPPPVPFLDTVHNFLMDLSWICAFVFVVVVALHFLTHVLGGNSGNRHWLTAYLVTGLPAVAFILLASVVHT